MSQYDTSSTSSSKIESLEQYETDARAKRNRWIAEIQYAEKEKEKFSEQGRKVGKRYLDERDDVSALDKKFNIFYANTEILKSALYTNLPKIAVSRRFSDPDDDVARVAARMLQRNLEQDLDEAHCDFDECLRNCVQDLLIPGLATAWLRMEVETEQRNIEATVVDGMEIAPAIDYEEVIEQEVYIDYVHWDDFIWSPAKVWAEVRWMGRKVFLTRDELVKRFGEEKGKKIPLDHKPAYRSGALDNTPKNEVFQQACIYEIWDKQSKKAIWVSKSCEELLDEQDDPLEIENFFPCPRPMVANTTTSNTVPKCDYVMFQDQYTELDTVNTRIQALIQACKVVGVYDRGAGPIQRMLQEGVDNTLIPVDNWAMFAEKGGVKGVIDWLPLDTVVRALERLEKNREDIKQQIYELTGIADIVRGSTKASETLGAQELKAKFAGVKIQSRQQQVTDFATHILRIKAQIICKHFTDKFILQRSNIDKTQDAPLAEAAIQLLKDHAASEWQIKIEPDSMARVDYAQDRQEYNELMNTVVAFMEKLVPAVNSAPFIAPFMMELLKHIVSKFRVGREVESSLDGMIKAATQMMNTPKPPPPDPAMIKAQAEVGALQQKTQAGLQATAMKTAAEIQMGKEKHQAELAGMMQEHQADAEQSEFKNILDLIKTVNDAAVKKEQAKNKGE
jgi:Skp family chaperone for outer membrane proteins